jgi:Pyridoxamine 5'-phosphate oxidase
MGALVPELSEANIEFIREQKMFFVATAPLSQSGRINLSPKGLDCFRVLGPQRVAWLDVIGSGNETSAHLQENGRVTVMFCSFDSTPCILRLYGTGRTVLPGSPEWEKLIGQFDPPANTRQLMVVDVKTVQKSCGFGVPMYEYTGERDHFRKWSDSRGEKGMLEYQLEKNRVSIDGLPTPLDEYFEKAR